MRSMGGGNDEITRNLKADNSRFFLHKLLCLFPIILPQGKVIMWLAEEDGLEVDPADSELLV